MTTLKAAPVGSRSAGAAAYIRGMADDKHQVTRGVAYFDNEGNQVSGLVDPLIAFYWARLDEEKAAAHGDAFLPPSKAVQDLAAKRAILDDYARYCADVDNPAREMICQVTRDVIKHLATVYAGHPDYDVAWRP